jgi:hypothetical protein
MEMSASPYDNVNGVYQQLCDSYRAVDDIRMKLLSLLPLATGAGILVLSDGGKTTPTTGVSAAVGVFGLVVTTGLLSYELHGIKKCAALIDAGKLIERRLQINGQFTRRPHEVAGFIDEPFAASIIYPAALAGWSFFALLGAPRWVGFVVAALIFILAASVSVWLIRAMESDFNLRKQYESEPLWHRSRKPDYGPLPDDAFMPDDLPPWRNVDAKNLAD